MNVLIIGGSKAAYYLITLLDRSKYSITMIDQRLDICEKIADEFEIDVFFGDGTDVAVLRRANCANMDVVLALTGKDENNLVCCQLAKQYFHVPLTISNVNNPRNSEAMNRLGVDKAISSTELLANLLEDEIEYQGLMTAYDIPGNNRAIVEFVLHQDSEAAGSRILDYQFPKNMTLVLITRENGDVLTPSGETVLTGGDHIHLVCDRSDYEEVWRTFVAPYAAEGETGRRRRLL